MSSSIDISGNPVAEINVYSDAFRLALFLPSALGRGDRWLPYSLGQKHFLRLCTFAHSSIEITFWCTLPCLLQSDFASSLD